MIKNIIRSTDSKDANLTDFGKAHLKDRFLAITIFQDCCTVAGHSCRHYMHKNYNL
jgi:hypothetical protein